MNVTLIRLPWRRVFLAMLTGAPLLLTGCAPSNPVLTAPEDHAPCVLTREGELPYQYKFGHLAVDITVDGKPSTMWFDSGAFRTLMDTSAATRLGLQRVQGLENWVRGIGGRQMADSYQANQVQFGLAHGEKWLFLVSHLFNAKDEDTSDGFLGSDMMWPFDLDLDMPDHKIVLYHAEHDCSSPSVFLHGDLYSVPLIEPQMSHTVTATQPPTRLLYRLPAPEEPWPKINVTINGQTLLAVIDTGAPENVLFRSGAAKIGLTDAQTAHDTTLEVYGISGHTPGVMHNFDEVDIGDLALAHFPMKVVKERSGNDFDLLLGMEFIEHFHLWISHSSATLVIQYPPRPSPPFAGP